MPTYDYECSVCGHKFEMLQSIKARPKKLPDEPCEGCGQRAPIRRLIGSGGAVLFKGTGFYETDYRSTNYKKAAKAEKESQTGATKDTSKTAPVDKKPAVVSKGVEAAAKPAPSVTT